MKPIVAAKYAERQAMDRAGDVRGEIQIMETFGILHLVREIFVRELRAMLEIRAIRIIAVQILAQARDGKDEEEQRADEMAVFADGHILLMRRK